MWLPDFRNYVEGPQYACLYWTTLYGDLHTSLLVLPGSSLGNRHGVWMLRQTEKSSRKDEMQWEVESLQENLKHAVSQMNVQITAVPSQFDTSMAQKKSKQQTPYD